MQTLFDSPYFEGRRAAEGGKSFEDCPFDPYTYEHQDWCWGFHEVVEERKREAMYQENPQ